MGRLLPALAVLAALASPATAVALPGDAAFGPLNPPDGAALPVDPNGIRVTYTCPVYRIADPGFPLFGGPKDYGVTLSTSPALGADGRLADGVRNPGSADPSVGPDGCSAFLGAGGAPPRIQETPGTYYWQVHRICTECPGEYETGPVRTLTLRSPVKPSLRASGRAYAGYPFFVALALTGAPDGTSVVVERRVGSGWKRAGSATALRGKAEAVVTLAHGAQQLRAVATIGSQRIEGDPTRLTVRRAAGWQTGARDDGAYRGRVGSRSVRLTAARHGRQVRSFRAFVPMLCPGVSPGQFTTQIGTATISRARVAPDGSFVASSTPRSGTAIRVRGRLKARKVSGRVELSVGSCSGNSAYSAARG
jgi:hypothetical protein